MPVGGRLFKGLSSGVGLATEAYPNHKDKKATPEAAAPTSGHAHDEPSSEDSDIDDDESTWVLDEVSQELKGPPPPYSEVQQETDQGPSQQPPSDKNLAAGFLARHPPPRMHHPASDLPVPVIIPQRRPREADRGFVLAYPPLLQDYAGIDQQTFLDLLTTLNKSCEGSQAFNVVNMAATATLFVPSILARITSRAVKAAASAGEEAQSRGQRNTFLDKINEGFFRPRGLWAMIVTWKPDSRQTIIPNLNLRSTLGSISNSNGTPTPGQTHNLANALGTSSGTTQGHIPTTDCAPLIYPPIDDAAASTAPLPHQKQSKLKSSQDFISNYLDRRHAADFTARHPDSAVGAPQPQSSDFASRWADPNHPANSGTLLGLVTGGTFDPRARRWGKKAQRQARMQGRELSEEDMRMAQMGRLDRRGRVIEKDGVRGRVEGMTGGNKKKGVRRMIRQDVCYLMVVRFPVEEMEAEGRVEM